MNVTGVIKLMVLLLALQVLWLSCKKDDVNREPQATVITATGDISTKLNEFRQLLGAALNTTTGQTSGRREINWDGVPDQFALQSLPANFFNPTESGSQQSLQRGFVYQSSGDFRVSAAGFKEVNASAAAEFASFSGNKSFANVSSALWTTSFQVAGQLTAATVKGFGVVFTDVDAANTSSLEFFDTNDKSLGKFFAPVHDNSSPHSFLGVQFSNARISKIKIAHGNGALIAGGKDISDGGLNDLVVLDDFLYDEPLAKQ